MYVLSTRNIQTPDIFTFEVIVSLTTSLVPESGREENNDLLGVLKPTTAATLLSLANPE